MAIAAGSPPLRMQVVSGPEAPVPLVTTSTLVVVEIDAKRFPVTEAVRWLMANAHRLGQAHSAVVFGTADELSDRRLIQLQCQGRIPGLLLMEKPLPAPAPTTPAPSFYEQPPYALGDEDFARWLDRYHAPEERDD